MASTGRGKDPKIYAKIAKVTDAVAYMRNGRLKTDMSEQPHTKNITYIYTISMAYFFLLNF